jgi:K(+)-stimulated pyrophosphate-energized sodium pump
MLAAVRRACADFLWRETQLLAGLLVIIGVALLVPWAIWGGAARAWAWGGCALFLGAASGAGIAALAHWASAHVAARSLEALRHDLDTGMTRNFRGSAAIAIATDAASLLLSIGIFGSHYLYLAWVQKIDVGTAIFEASLSLPAAALGALAAAAVFQVGGSSLHTAAGVAGTSARARHAHVARDEEQNPALIAELMGDYVGGVVCRSTDVFSALVLANACLLLLAGLVARANAAVGVGALALVFLPLVVRATGLLATGISVASLRFDARSSATRSFAAAGASHVLMLATGLFGASLWLLGDPLYPTYVAAGALGILPGLLAAGLVFLRSRRPAVLEAERDAVPAPRAEQSVARALGLGLQHTGSPLLLVGMCLGAAWLLGSRAPLARGGAFALVVAVASMLGAGALNLCESLFATLAESMGRIVLLRRAVFDAAARERVLQMECTGLAIGNLGQTQSILGGAAAALLGALILPLLQAPGSAPDAAPGFGHPIVILGGVLGAGSLLFHIGGVLRSASRAASTLDKDLQTRLDATARPRQVPSPPSYRVSVQLAMSAATEALLPLTLSAVLMPFAVGVLLRVVYGPSGSAIIAQGLMAFASVAALTGCFAALAAQGTLVALGASRQSPFVAPGPTAAAANSAGKFMGRCIAPAALLGLKATVVSSLAIVPLLF